MSADRANAAQGCDFDIAFTDLKACVENLAAGRAKLSVKHYSGSGGIRVVCQEAFHHNFDLTHEHWNEIIEPDVEQDGDEIYARRNSGLAFVHLLLTGDKASGKTTFLNGLTTGDLRVLQALRYESASFYNIWYAPSAIDLTLLRQSLTTRHLPFFQTELAHGSMLMDAPELRFFLEDEEFASGQPPPDTTLQALDCTQHVLVKLLELGGDCLHELLELDRPDFVAEHPVKAALLRQTATAVHLVARVAYFVNLSALFTSSTQTATLAETADTCGPGVLVKRLQFLNKMLREDAEVLCICKRPVKVNQFDVVALICQQLTLSASDTQAIYSACCPGESPETGSTMTNAQSSPPEMQIQLKIVHWLAIYAGFDPSRVRVVGSEHLHADGTTDHTAILQSLRHMLAGDVLNTKESALPLLAEQVAYLLFDNRVACIDKATLADLLEPFEDDGYAEVYRNVIHPMIAVPPMVLLDSFSAIMAELVRRGLACPASRQGEVPIQISFDSANCAVMLSPVVSSRDSTAELGAVEHVQPVVCWRILVQSEIVVEALSALNLFKLQAASPSVSTADAVRILAEAWKAAAAAWSSSSSPNSFSELFLATRFLLVNGHENLPEPWTLHSAPDDLQNLEWNRIHLSVPQEMFDLLRPESVSDNPSFGIKHSAYLPKRLRVDS